MVIDAGKYPGTEFGSELFYELIDFVGVPWRAEAHASTSAGRAESQVHRIARREWTGASPLSFATMLSAVRKIRSFKEF